MLKYIFTILILITPSVIANGQITQRNTNNDEKISVIVPISESPYPTIVKVGDFIWRHWTERTTGYAEMMLYSKEGDQSKSFIAIEPDEKGVWRVVVQIERKLHDRRFIENQQRSGEITYQTYSYEAYTVEQIKSSKRKTNIKSNHQNERARLRFNDKNGKFLTEW